MAEWANEKVVEGEVTEVTGRLRQAWQTIGKVCFFSRVGREAVGGIGDRS